MKKRWHNIKVTTLLIAMLLIILFSISSLIVIGYSKLKSVNSNVTTIYSDNLIPISQLGQLRYYVMAERLSVAKCIWGDYDQVEADKVEAAKVQAEKIENEFELAFSSDEERKEFHNYKKAKDEYFAYWKVLKEKRVNY